MPICKACGKDSKHKARGLCLTCYRKQYNAEYRGAHKEELLQSKKEYRITNRDKINASARIYRYANGGKPMNENKKCSMFLGVHVAERVLSKVFKDVKQMPPNHIGYDFVCSKDKKIDVKCSCTRTRHNHGDSWAFHTSKNKIADYFLCLAFDNREDLNPLHMWIIPGNIINHLKNATISESALSKWDKYKLDTNKVTACCDVMKQTNQKKVT